MDRDISHINSEFTRLNDAGLLTEAAKRKEKGKGKYHIRNGLTKKPCFKTIDCTKMLPPLHYWICSLKHMENMAYIINTPKEKFPKNKYVMGKGKRKGKVATKAVGDSKKNFITKARNTPGLGILLDSPSGAGTGGSTDGANNARFFFSESNRELILDLYEVDDVDRAKLCRILRHSVQFC